MGTISVTTTQNIELEYELAGLSDRIFARLIDLFCLGGYIVLFVAIIGFGNIDPFFSNNPWLAIILLIVPIIFYHLYCETFFNGQSIGKMALKIRVISLNGNQPALSQYLIRWLFRIVDFPLTGNLLAVILVAASEKQQRLGDMLAGTAVIKTKPKTNLSHTIYEPVDMPVYNPVYPEVIQLSDNDIRLVKEVILNAHRYTNTNIVFDTMKKIESILHIQNKNESAIQFLYTIVQDYNYLASKL
ncbi:MAG: RDD family protein [Bacteroidetes bacterium]|nr:RDD family protein [Bacteroidota bacterium]